MTQVRCTESNSQQTTYLTGLISQISPCWLRTGIPWTKRSNSCAGWGRGTSLGCSENSGQPCLLSICVHKASLRDRLYIVRNNNDKKPKLVWNWERNSSLFFSPRDPRKWSSIFILCIPSLANPKPSLCICYGQDCGVSWGLDECKLSKWMELFHFK